MKFPLIVISYQSVKKISKYQKYSFLNILFFVIVSCHTALKLSLKLTDKILNVEVEFVWKAKVKG